MKKPIYYLLLLITLALSVEVAEAQPLTVKVSFKGNSPTIIDFVMSYSRAHSNNELFSDFANDVKGGTRNYVGTKIVSDVKNGYVSREVESGEDGSVSKIEMCYWNCANKKEKIFAVNVISLENGGFDESSITFYRYDKANGVMKKIPAPFDRKVKPLDFANPQKTRPERINYARNVRNEDANAWPPIFTLPRIGKDIEIRIADANQLRPSERQRLRYVWNGNGFTLTRVN